jgi:hypothetical protein
MHKKAELIDVAKQVEEHLHAFDLHGMISMPDVHGKPMAVKVRIKNGLVQAQTMDNPWPLILLMARDQPWRGHDKDDPSVGVVSLLAPWFLEPGSSRYSFAVTHARRFRQAAIGDALASALMFGTIEPIPEQELVDDIAEQVREAAKNIETEYQSFGPGKRHSDATSELHVTVYNGMVTFKEWTDVYAATGEPEAEGDILLVETSVELVELMDRGVKHRQSYGNRPQTGIVDVLALKSGQRIIVDTALEYISYHGGEESHVSELGSDD